jgi:hypothetical protein
MILLFFVMQALDVQNVPDRVLAAPQVAGVHLRTAWGALDRGSPWLDDQLARVGRLGKRATLGVYAGTNSPPFPGVQHVAGAPLPWDPRVLAAWDQLVLRLARYDLDPRVYAVHLSSPATYESMEMHLPAGLYRVRGYSDAKVIAVWQRSIDAFATALPHQTLILDLALVPNSRGGITWPVLQYAQARLGARLIVIHCSLKASTNVQAPHHQAVLTSGSRIGFEMACPSADRARFGGSFAQALAIGQAAGAEFYQIYQSDVAYLGPAAP